MILEVNNLRKTFANGTKALQGVNFSINTGEFVVILGASGSGKTTLLRSINGLVKCENGEIKFHNNVFLIIANCAFVSYKTLKYQLIS